MFALMRTDNRLRGAIRFGVAIAIANVVAIAVFGPSPAVAIGSLAVIVLLYFLDFDGTWRERLLGYSIATLVGAVALVLGVVAAEGVYLAIGLSFVAGFVIAMARVLRGYVARSVVGLAIAYFWPVMLPAKAADLGTLLLSWLIGCGIAVVVAMVVLPPIRSRNLCDALAAWLSASGVLANALTARTGLAEASEELACAGDRLRDVIKSPRVSLGSISRRQRAIGEMASRAMWAQPLVAGLTPDECQADSALAGATASAFGASAMLISGAQAAGDPPDLELLRQVQLERMDGETEAQVLNAYPLRVTSMLASLQLWLAASTRGISVPKPVVGDVSEESPGAILRASFALKSLWLRAAILSGLGGAVCVALVGALGLEQGLWVVLATLICFQASFSPTESRLLVIVSAISAMGGVLISGVIFFLDPPIQVYVLLLPFAAAAAKYAQGSRVWLAQLLFTPFLLINLVSLGATPGPSLAIERVQDVTIGAIVAGLLTLAIFPIGIARQLSQLAAEAQRATSAYAAAMISLAKGHGGPVSSRPTRSQVVHSIAQFESGLSAGQLAMRASDPALQQLDRIDAYARACLMAGDICEYLAGRPGGQVPASAIAKWWAHVLKVREPAGHDRSTA